MAVPPEVLGLEPTAAGFPSSICFQFASAPELECGAKAPNESQHIPVTHWSLHVLRHGVEYAEPCITHETVCVGWVGGRQE